MSDLKKHLTDGTIAQAVPALETKDIAVALDGKDFVVTTLSVEYLAREFAGVFFEQNRSKKFRSIWGTSDKQQLRYIDHNWHSFIASAREVMVKMLTNPATPEDQKMMIYEAFIAEAALQQAMPQESGGIQLAPGTEAFDGEKSLNKDVDELEA